MKMIDYNGVKHNDRAYDRTQTDVIGDTGNTPGLVKPWLGSDGYPEAVKTGKSLAGLYQNAQEVNHLLRIPIRKPDILSITVQRTLLI